MIRRPPRSTRTDTLFPTRRSSDLWRGSAASRAYGKPSPAPSNVSTRPGADGLSCLRTNPFKLETPAMQLDRAVDAPRAQGGTAVHYRPPRKTDGTRIWALIRSIAALDDNSLYCNLLQCSHFAGTCALAEIDGRAVGWISGYLPPEKDRKSTRLNSSH